jgi:hypothetical protein
MTLYSIGEVKKENFSEKESAYKFFNCSPDSNDVSFSSSMIGNIITRNKICIRLMPVDRNPANFNRTKILLGT